MRTPKPHSALLGLIVILLCSPLPAQDANGTGQNPRQAHQEEMQGTQILRPAWVSTGTPMEERSFLNLGFSASYGRDTAVNNVRDLDSQFTNIQGSLGAAHRSRTTSLALRHDATVLQFPTSNIDLQQYHWTTFNLTHLSSRRTTWGLNLANAYGADSVRATSSLSLSSVNDTPANDSVLAGVIVGNTLRQYASLLTDHQVSATRAFTLGANASFHNFLGRARSTRQFNLNGALRQYWGEYVLVGLRVDGVRQNFGTGNCTTGSVSGFTTVQLTTALRFDGSAGPAFGSAQCTGNYQYQAVVSAQSVRGNRLYLGTSRKRGNGAVAGSLWETAGFGGMQLGNPRRFIVATNGGYATYHGGTISSLNSDVSGYFISGEFHRPLGRHAEWSFTARHFQRNISSVDMARTVFFVTFAWQKQDGGSDGR